MNRLGPKWCAYIPLTFSLLAVLMSPGCDAHREEREALRGELESMRSERIDALNAADKAASDESDWERYKSSQRSKLSSVESRMRDETSELVEYAMDHKLASAAAVSTVGGLSGLFDEYIGSDWGSIIGIAGALYCIWNSSECADAAVELGLIAGRIYSLDSEKSDIISNMSEADSGIANAQARRIQSRQQADQIEYRMTEIETEIENLSYIGCSANF